MEFTSPVRVCLAGEDLDWLGFRCCCVAVDLPTRIVPCVNGSPHRSLYLDVALSVIARYFPIQQQSRPDFTVTNEAPIAGGLSSSTALTTALVKACLARLGVDPIGPVQLAELSYETEHNISGCGGMDQLTIAHGGVLLMKGKPKGLPDLLGRTEWPEDIGFILIDTGIPKSTQTHIKDVRLQVSKHDKALDQYVLTVDNCAQTVWDAIQKGDLIRLASAINRSHDAMRDFQGMVPEHIELIRKIAFQSGCPSVKLTGAGGGGCLFAVAPVEDIPLILGRLNNAYSQGRMGATAYPVKPDNMGACYARCTQ